MIVILFVVVIGRRFVGWVQGMGPVRSRDRPAFRRAGTPAAGTRGRFSGFLPGMDSMAGAPY